MMSQTDKFHGGRLAETEIQVPPATNEDKVLCRLNQSYRLSKAQQILRLLKDQDDLNQRFRDCALLDEEEEAKEKERRKQEGDEDTWSLQEEKHSEAEDSDTSENEADRRAARRVALRKHRNSIDPGRCKTSMGFYDQAEVTEIPYDTDSDSVPGLDSACSTPRGVSSGALSARQPAQQNLYWPANGGRSGGAGGNSRLRVYHLKMGENDVNVRELAIPEECVVQSARSSRPQTSIATSSARSRYYRQQPHPESRHSKPSHHHNHNSHSKQLQQHQQQQQQQQSRGMGDTRQAIISRLDPHHPMAVRPFCEMEEASRPQLTSSQPSTPRGGVRNQGSMPYFNHHTEVTLFDMAPAFSQDTPTRSNSRRAAAGGGPGGHGTSITRSTSFMEHQRVVPANRTLLSVDSSPVQLGDVSPRGRNPGEVAGGSRRPRSTRVKKRVGEMPRGAVPTSMHVIGERAHPAMTVMKLPPLETAVNKTGSGRDLVCVGKD